MDNSKENEHYFQTVIKKFECQQVLAFNLQKQEAVLSQELSITETQLNEAIKQNKSLAHEQWMLGQEKAQLAGQLKQLGVKI